MFQGRGGTVLCEVDQRIFDWISSTHVPFGLSLTASNNVGHVFPTEPPLCGTFRSFYSFQSGIFHQSIWCYGKAHSSAPVFSLETAKTCIFWLPWPSLPSLIGIVILITPPPQKKKKLKPEVGGHVHCTAPFHRCTVVILRKRRIHTASQLRAKCSLLTNRKGGGH